MIVGIGCDIVEVERIHRLMTKGLANKLLTKREMELFVSLSEQRKVEWLAGRFAAKEAIFKALPKGIVTTISQIEVDCDEDGKPCCFSPNVKIHISISHESSYAIAYAICEQK